MPIVGFCVLGSRSSLQVLSQERAVAEFLVSFQKWSFCHP